MAGTNRSTSSYRLKSNEEVLKQSVLMESGNDFGGVTGEIEGSEASTHDDVAHHHHQIIMPRSPSPPTHSWPLTQNYRTQVRSCIEFSTPNHPQHYYPEPSNTNVSTPRTPMSEATGLMLMTHRLSNPFLLDFGLLTNNGGEDPADEIDDDEEDYSTSHSLSLLSNDEISGDGLGASGCEQDDDDDDTLSSTGTLSEVFESLSRFSEDCLASVEALTSPQGNNARTPKAVENYTFASSLEQTPSTSRHHQHQMVTECSKFDRLSSSNNPFVACSQQHHQNRKLQKVQKRQFWANSSTGASYNLGTSSNNSASDNIKPTTNTPDNIFMNSILQFPFFEFGDVMSTTKSNISDRRRVLSMPNDQNQQQLDQQLQARVEEESRHFQDLLLLPEEINSIVSFTIGDPISSQQAQSVVSCLDWQERCVELEIALQRFGEQASRVRLFLRDKVRNLSISLLSFLSALFFSIDTLWLTSFNLRI